MTLLLLNCIDLFTILTAYFTESICLLYCCLLLQQHNFPTGIHKVPSYLFMSAERSASICTFIHSFFTAEELCSFYRTSKSQKSRSDACGNPQVSCYRRETHRNQPSPILRTPHLPPPPSSEKGPQSRSNWFDLCFNSMSSLFFFPLSFILPSSLPSLFSLSGEAQRTGMNTYKHGGGNTKTLKQTNVASMLLYPHCCVLHPYCIYWA